MVDLINRDPNDINGHIKGEFEDILAEPEGIRSIEFCWKISYTCFNFWKGCCYKLVTFFCAMCIAMSWGCHFAGIAFQHVWCITPMFVVCQMQCVTMRKFYFLFLDCFLGPVCESCGLCCSKIRITKA